MLKMRHMVPKSNMPHSIYQYSNIGPRLTGQSSISGVVLFMSKSLLRIERQDNFDPKASEHVRILIC